MAENIYIGNGKKIDKYDMINFSICLSDIPKEYINKSEKNGKSYVNLTMSGNRDGVDKFGNSHNVKINTWKPEEKSGTVYGQMPNIPLIEDDLPF